MKHRLSSICLIFLLLLLAIALPGCVRQSAEKAESVQGLEVLQSRSPRLAGDAAIAPTVYVSLRDSTNRVFGLRGLMERALEARGYAITKNPSQAGYILQMTVTHAGEASPDAVRRAVPLGYGQDADMAGEGACVLVADALVASRTLPSSRRSPVLANASRRSTVADEQVRVAAMLPGRDGSFTRNHSRLEQSVVEAVAAIFPTRQR